MPSSNFSHPALSITMVLAQLLYNVMPSGKYFCQLLTVCCITDFFPATAPSGGRFPITFHLFIASSYHDWSHPSILSFQRLKLIMIHCFFMLLAVLLVLRCHSASSDHHNLHLLLVCLTYFTDAIPQMSHSLLENNLSL